MQVDPSDSHCLGLSQLRAALALIENPPAVMDSVLQRVWPPSQCKTVTFDNCAQNDIFYHQFF